MERLTAQQIENLPEWIPVRDFEGFYEVNCRAGIIRNARTFEMKKPSPNNKGYPQVRLRKDGKGHTKTVHRLVANAAFGYYGVPTVGLDVCHLDEERNDTRISNLALGSHQENMNFEKAKQRNSEAKKGEKNYWFGKHKSEEIRKKMSESHKGKRLSEEIRKKMSESHKGEKNYWFGKHKSEETRMKMSEAHSKKAVGAYKNDELVMTFQSTAEAGKNGFNQGNISSCCTGKLRTHKGFQWRFLDTTAATMVG